MKLRPNRTTERAGVNAARAFFESHKQVFQEVELSNDYGKDAYVDFTHDEQVLGVCAGLQIKAGESYRRKAGYAIPVEGHLQVWRDSSVPMVGIVYDEQSDKLYWVSISAFLERCGASEPSSIPIDESAELTPTSLRLELLPAVRASKRVDALGSALLQLCSSDPAVQIAAIGDCFALGRGDVRVMLAIRNSLRSFRGDAVKQAIATLSHAVPHPDIWFNSSNTVPTQVEHQLANDLVWAQEELAVLFRAVPWAEGWDRGSLGQCLYHLLIVDPDCKAKVHAIVPVLAITDCDAAFAAMYLVLHWSESPREMFAQLLEANPMLQKHELVGEVSRVLDELGGVPMW